MTPPERTELVVPDAVLEPSISLYDAAVALSSVFRIVPVTSTPTARKPGADASKNPGGLLGREWPSKSTTDESTLYGWFSAVPDHTSGPLSPGTVFIPDGWYRTVEPETVGMGLHVGTEVVVVDIDYPDKVPAEMWEYLDGAPFQSSSATDPRRGHYFFRARDGVYFGQTSAVQGRDGAGSPGEIRHGNAIVVSAPTKHSKAALGRRYEWKRAGAIPEMSEQIADWLQSEKRAATFNGATLEIAEADLESIERFREVYELASAPELLAEHLAFMERQANISGLHSTTLAGLIDLLQYAMFGFITGAEAIDGAAQQFVRMRTDPHRGDGSWIPETSSEEDARAEFIDLLKWALGRLLAKYKANLPALQYETYELARYWYSVDLPEIPQPEGYVIEPPGGGGFRDLYHPNEGCAEDGRPLVKNAHTKMAEACAERLTGRFTWVLNGGTGDGEWWVYDDEQAVWGRGGQRAIVAREVKRILSTEVAVYDIFETEKFTRTATKEQRDTVEMLRRLNGRTSVIYRLTMKPSEHLPEINYVVDALKLVPEMWSKVEQFDVTSTKVALANGVLDVKTTTFEAATPENRITKRAPVVYDPAADCPKFKQFVLDCVVKNGDYAEAEKVAGVIQRYFGAALLGDWGSDNFLVAHGPAGSGKSTVFEDVARAVLGDTSGYWSMITPQVFTRGISEAGRKFELASVAGARFLTCNEAFEGSSGIEEGFLKAFTDGSTQRAAFKGRDNFMMTPGRVVFMSNALPKMSGVDAGISRRAIFIEFPYGHDKSDPTLPDPDEKLFERDLIPELPGILNWMIQGARDYLVIGIDAPASIYAGTKSSLSDSSVMGQFLQHFRPVNEDDPKEFRDGSTPLALKDIMDLYTDFLEMVGVGGKNSPNTVSSRRMAESIVTQFRTVKVDMETRSNFYTDDGLHRRKYHAVNGLMPNEDFGSYLITRGMTGPKGTVHRSRIGIGEVEDWRRIQLQMNRATAGTPI